MMQLKLSPEQQNEILVHTLITDYRRILSGYYEAETLQYSEAFEKIMGFYLNEPQRNRVLALTKIYVKVDYPDDETEYVLNNGEPQELEYASVEEANERVVVMKRIYPENNYYIVEE